jgi:deoxyribose-phosphate aldolase
MSLARYIDHTILKPTTTRAEVEKVCAEALRYGFAAVCVPPPFVRFARQLLAGQLMAGQLPPGSEGTGPAGDTPEGNNPAVKVATVIGFPFGYSAVEAKVSEILLAIVDGADELDMVINLVALKNNDWTYLAGEIGTILPLVHAQGKVLKVIVESGILTDEELIRCCTIYGTAGVDFLKTSTGYAEKGATLEAVEIMRKHLPSSVQIKASGGIRTAEFAEALITAGATRLGSSSGVSIAEHS